MRDDEAFLGAIRADPGDEAPWLIYADWLEERGDPLAAAYRRRRLTNSVGMTLVLIPPGTFLMGSPPDEVERTDAEGPQHEVEITRPFYLGAYPVTQEEYQKVMGVNPSHFSPSGEGRSEVTGLDTRRFPVEAGTWDDPVAFCRRLSELPEENRYGRQYRLPTEAEWEYACRGGARDAMPFYFKRPTAALSSAQANFDGNHPYGGALTGPCLERTTAVGSYPPNAFGLYDMHGNVWECCSDWYDPYYYSQSPRQDPQGPRGLSSEEALEGVTEFFRQRPPEPQTGISVERILGFYSEMFRKDPEAARRGQGRVLRGGAWYVHGGVCRAASRGRYAAGIRNNYIGFRVALAAGGTTP
jgi:uncharacterized protein (TIGR02996 family)